MKQIGIYIYIYIRNVNYYYKWYNDYENLQQLYMLVVSDSDHFFSF